MPEENPVMKRVRVRKRYRESPVAERESADVYGKWLRRGVAEPDGNKGKAATGPPVIAVGY